MMEDLRILWVEHRHCIYAGAAGGGAMAVLMLFGMWLF